MRIKSIYAACLLAVLFGASSCIFDNGPVREDSLSLVLQGNIDVDKDAVPELEVGTKAEAVPVVNSVRVLIFDGADRVVTNKTVGFGGVMRSDGNYVIALDAGQEVKARIGTNHVYVVLNEAALPESFDGVADRGQMERIRDGRASYNSLIRVEDGTEPAFVMCVYDVVEIVNGDTVLDITGLGMDSPVYGFPMRRTMAKIVLESVVGGVRPDGKILGTDIVFDPASTTDQTGDQDVCSVYNGEISDGGNANANLQLAATSELFVTKVELVNIPAEYSWRQDKDDSQDAVAYDGPYLQDQEILTGVTPEASYIDRTWYGDIMADGTVDFTRTDALPIIWRQDEKSSGKNSYGIQEAYAFSSIWGEDNYTTNGPYIINSGNFVPWVKEVYGEGHVIPGEIVPGNIDLSSRLNPAAWALHGNTAYYVPENIHADPNAATSLRVHFSVGTIMAQITEEEVKNIIDDALGDNRVPIVGEDGTELIINSNDNWQSAGITFVRNQGKFVPNPSTVGDGYLSDGTNVGTSLDQAWGVCYEGLKTIWKGYGVAISERVGSYYVDRSSATDSFYIDVPLNNDSIQGGSDIGEGFDDHNIYRGHEYRVKLFVTRSSIGTRSSSPIKLSASVSVMP